MRGAAAALALLLACPLTADEGALFSVYQKYVAAIENDDLAAAKSYLSAGKISSLSGMTNEQALASIDVLSPKANLRPHKETIEDDDGTLVVIADVEENEAAGHIQFVREKGAWKVLSELWDLGGDPDLPPGDVPQPKNDQQRAAIRKLRERGFPAPSAEFLVMSAATGDLEAVKLFVEAGYSVDSVGQGSPAIVTAAMSGHRGVVLYLIEAGADVNAQDEVHTTALMRIADKCDATDVVRALLEAGAKTDIKSDGGSTALQLAEWSNCEANAALIRSKASS